MAALQLFDFFLVTGHILALAATVESRNAPSFSSYRNAPALVGEIKLYAGNASFLPYSWVFCDGQALSRIAHQDLFSVIGVSFGAGDGTSTFNVPDFRHRFPLGFDPTKAQMTGFNSGGSSTKTLTFDQMPNHQHNQGSLRIGDGGNHGHGIHDPGHNHGGSTEGANGGPGPHNLQRKNSGSFDDQGWHSHNIRTGHTGISISAGGTHSHSISGSTGAAGNGQPFDIMPPFQSINYIIFIGD